MDKYLISYKGQIQFTTVDSISEFKDWLATRNSGNYGWAEIDLLDAVTYAEIVQAYWNEQKQCWSCHGYFKGLVAVK